MDGSGFGRFGVGLEGVGGFRPGEQGAEGGRLRIRRDRSGLGKRTVSAVHSASEYRGLWHICPMRAGGRPGPRVKGAGDVVEDRTCISNVWEAELVDHDLVSGKRW